MVVRGKRGRNIHHQGTRRYCKQCGRVMFRTKQHGGLARGTIWLFKDSSRHQVWGR